MNNDYEMDGASFSSRSETDFLSFLNEREDNAQWLEEEINEERRKQGKKEFRFEEKTEEKKVKMSNTDPESGYYHRDNKEKGFMYLDHRTVDSKCNIIVDCHVTKGNVHDSQPFIERAEYIRNPLRFLFTTTKPRKGRTNKKIPTKNMRLFYYEIPSSCKVYIFILATKKILKKKHLTGIINTCYNKSCRAEKVALHE